LRTFFSAFLLITLLLSADASDNIITDPASEASESDSMIQITWFDLAFVNFFPLQGTRFADFSDMNLGAEVRLNYMLFNIKPLWISTSFLVDWNKTNSKRLDSIIDIAASIGAGWRFPMFDKFFLTPKLSYGFMVHSAYGDYYNDPDIYPGDSRAGTKANYLFSDQYMHYEAEFAYDISSESRDFECEVFFSPSFIHFIEKVRQGYEYGYMVGTRVKVDTFFSRKKKETKKIIPSIIAGKVIDAETLNVLNGTVPVITGGEYKNAELSIGETFAFNVEPGEGYSLKAEREGYNPITYEIKGETIYPGKKNSVILAMKPSRIWGLIDYIHEKGTDEPIEGVNVIITDSNGKIQEVATGKNGEFRMEVPPETDYSMIMKKKGYFTIRGEFTTKKKNPGWYKVMNVMATEFQKSVVGATMEFGNINYDPSSAVIRPDGIPSMDRMVQFLLDNSNIVVELGSHTDTRGSHAVADDLSQRRAQSAMEYLIKKGISTSRISAKGYGKRKLKNHCSDGVKCSAAELQANRRTELTVKEILSK